MVGYHAVDDRSRSHEDRDVSELNLSSKLRCIIGDQEIDSFKAIIHQEYREKEKMLEYTSSKLWSLARRAWQTALPWIGPPSGLPMKGASARPLLRQNHYCGSRALQA